MYAEVLPDTATDKRVEWSVTDMENQETKLAEITSSGKLTPFKNGKVKVVAKAVDGSHIQGEKVITLENQDKENLAYQKPGFASHAEGANPLQDAFDGKIDTRWASGQQSDDQWITVDLGDVYQVNKVVLYWESYALEYKIQGSMDNKTFYDLYVEKSGQGNIEEKTFDAKPARYVKMQCVKSSSQYGSSLWEFQVYGDHYEKTYVDKINISTESGQNTITVKNKPLQLIANIQPVDATITTVEWAVYNQDESVTDLATITKDGKLVPKQNGIVKVVAQATDGSGIKTEIMITITGQDAKNIAFQKTATATSQTDSNDANKVTDGKTNTRWAAQNNDNESITIDLEQPCYQVSILWENAYAKGYKIQGSLDDHNYFDIHYETNGQGSLENIYFDTTLVKYVKMQGIKRAIGYGYSIYEFEIYGKALKEDLEVFYNAIVNTDASLYTPNNYHAFQDILKQADIILKKEDASETDVTSILKKLHEVYEALIYRAQTDLLKIELDKAQTIKSEQYTPSSFKNLQMAFEQATKVYRDQNATQLQVDEVCQQLKEAISRLITRGDKQKLGNLLKEVNQLNQSLYTEESLKGLMTAKNNAQNIFNNQDATEQQIQNIYQELKSAYDNLIQKPSIDVKPNEVIISSVDQSVHISGALPKNIQLESFILNQKEMMKVFKELQNKNPEFFKRATLEKVYDLHLFLKGEKYNLDETVKVAIQLDDNLRHKNLEVIYIDESGHIHKLDSVKEGQYINFETTHFSQYAIVSYNQIDSQTVIQEQVNTSDQTQFITYSGLSLISIIGIYILLKNTKKKYNQ